MFDGDHFDNHLHGSATNDEDSGRLQLLLAITEEANRNGNQKYSRTRTGRSADQAVSRFLIGITWITSNSEIHVKD